MATATQTRPQQEQGTWSKIFPADTVTEQQSALFVKKLLAVAVSNITYLRAIFPEHAFGDRCLEDLSLKILRDDSSCPGACQVIKWVKGCFDALEKKYLRVLIIGLYVDPNDPETVIESYTFKFSYTDQTQMDVYRNSKKFASATSAAETKKATIRLLRTILVLTQSLSSLPDEVMMTMKLLYYDDVTPPEYEPPGFKAADAESFQFNDEPMNIKVGDVNTPFHTVKLRIKTNRKQFEQVDEEGMEMGTQQSEMEDAQNVHNEEESAELRKLVTLEPAEADVPSDTPAKPEEQAVDTTGSEAAQTQSQGDFGVQCPCGYNEDDGLMILCAKCRFWQHGICFMIMKEEQAPTQHICSTCADVDDINLHATDPQLVGKPQITVQTMCLWRRALHACTEVPRIVIPNFARRLGVEMPVAQGLINRLEKEGFIKQATKGAKKKLAKTVNKEKLEEGLSKYFQPPEVQNTQVEHTQADDMEVTQVEVLRKDKTKEDNIASQVEKLVEKTEVISLSGNQKAATKSKLKKVEKEQEKKRGRKRVRAVDQETEFDISDSQEATQDIQQDTRKKRKASKARKPLMV